VTTTGATAAAIVARAATDPRRGRSSIRVIPRWVRQVFSRAIGNPPRAQAYSIQQAATRKPVKRTHLPCYSVKQLLRFLWLSRISRGTALKYPSQCFRSACSAVGGISLPLSEGQWWDQLPGCVQTALRLRSLLSARIRNAWKYRTTEIRCPYRRILVRSARRTKTRPTARSLGPGGGRGSLGEANHSAGWSEPRWTCPARRM